MARNTVGKTVFGVEEMAAKLNASSLMEQKSATLTVSFDTPYAVFVHEDLEAHHPNGGKAKFLETPARRLSRKMAETVSRSLKAKNGLVEGLQRAGDMLLRAAKIDTPVDTGKLRDSGAAKVEVQK